LGALQIAFEKLKQKLQAEGLFASERKRALPRYPQRIGLITSFTPSGRVAMVLGRRPEAVEVVKRLVATADVVWENFRPGVMDKLGVGYDALSAINPKLIYCSVSGFGHTGPERTTAAFDGKLQAMSGIMSITGEPAGGPMRAGFAICDTIGGITAALAVSSALYQRTHTGKGQFVDVAMLDAALAFIPGPVSEYTVAGI
jgi:crotonobetainyl-CoA:carnitine CoA-transferase CaiB-like acyl-CoA transferase